MFQCKKSGKLRMCIDNRTPNYNTVNFACPMPCIEQLFERRLDCMVVQNLNLAYGFHKVRINPNAIPKALFDTHVGAFVFTFMPFGLPNAPAQFTLLMNSALKGRDFVVAFMDDISVFSTSLDEHHDHIVRCAIGFGSMSCVRRRKCVVSIAKQSSIWGI